MSTFRKFWETRPRTDYSEFFDDFHIYTAAHYTVTKVGTGTVAVTPGVGGQLLITNSAADNDAVSHQLINETFRFAPNKALEFEARFKLGDAVQSDLILGLAITDTTPNDAPDGIFFLKADDAATCLLKVVKNSVASTFELPAGTLANDTWVKLGFYFDGASERIDCFINDQRAGAVAITNAPDDEELAVTFGLTNGAGAAKTATLDYVRVVQER